MSRSDTLPIFIDTYKFLLDIYKITGTFPREYKFSLGQDLKRDALDLFRHIYRANHAQDKSDYLDDFLRAFELVRLELRLCRDLDILPVRKMADLALTAESVGRQATAWKKHCDQKKRKAGERKVLVSDGIS